MTCSVEGLCRRADRLGHLDDLPARELLLGLRLWRLGQRLFQRARSSSRSRLLVRVHGDAAERHSPCIVDLLRRCCLRRRALRECRQNQNRASQQDSGQSSHLQASSKWLPILTYRRAYENSHYFVCKQHPIPRQADGAAIIDQQSLVDERTQVLSIPVPDIDPVA